MKYPVDKRISATSIDLTITGTGDPTSIDFTLSDSLYVTLQANWTPSTLAGVEKGRVYSISVIGEFTLTLPSGFISDNITGTSNWITYRFKAISDTTIEQIADEYLRKTGGVITGDVTIQGNLVVNGSTQTGGSSTITDAIQLINSAQTGTPPSGLISGIEIERGDLTNYHIVYRESDKTVRIGEIGSTQAIATRPDTPTDGGFAKWNGTTRMFDVVALDITPTKISNWDIAFTNQHEPDTLNSAAQRGATIVNANVVIGAGSSLEVSNQYGYANFFRSLSNIDFRIDSFTVRDTSAAGYATFDSLNKSLRIGDDEFAESPYKLDVVGQGRFSGSVSVDGRTLNLTQFQIWDANSADGHTHPNLTLLNAITQTDVDRWNLAYTNQHSPDTLDSVLGRNNVSTRGMFCGALYVDKIFTANTYRTQIDNIDSTEKYGRLLRYDVTAASYKGEIRFYNDGRVAILQGGSQRVLFDNSPKMLIDVAAEIRSNSLTVGTGLITAAKIAAWDSTTTSSHSHANLTTLNGITSASISNWNTAYNNSHAHSNKTTLDSITSALIANWNTAFTNTHTHNNKAVLDAITTTLTTNWNTAYTNSHAHANKTQLDGITATLIANWNTAYANSHTHSNKTTLDGITNALVNNWNAAFTNNHTHANKSVLDGVTSALVTNWNTAYANRWNKTGNNLHYTGGRVGFGTTEPAGAIHCFSDGLTDPQLILQKSIVNSPIYISGKNEAGASKWMIGSGILGGLPSTNLELVSTSDEIVLYTDGNVRMRIGRTAEGKSKIVMSNLPLSAGSLGSGELWKDANGFLRIS